MQFLKVTVPLYVYLFYHGTVTILDASTVGIICEIYMLPLGAKCCINVTIHWPRGNETIHINSTIIYFFQHINSISNSCTSCMNTVFTLPFCKQPIINDIAGGCHYQKPKLHFVWIKTIEQKPTINTHQLTFNCACIVYTLHRRKWTSHGCLVRII